MEMAIIEASLPIADRRFSEGRTGLRAVSGPPRRRPRREYQASGVERNERRAGEYHQRSADHRNVISLGVFGMCWSRARFAPSSRVFQAVGDEQ
jgi:hypothetical protein